LPIKVFFQIRRFVKRGLKDQYCGNGKLYFTKWAIPAAFTWLNPAPFCPQKAFRFFPAGPLSVMSSTQNSFYNYACTLVFTTGNR